MVEVESQAPNAQRPDAQEAVEIHASRRLALHERRPLCVEAHCA